MPAEQLANVGVIGMAVMGSNLARNLARNGNVSAADPRAAEAGAEMLRHSSDDASSRSW